MTVQVLDSIEGSIYFVLIFLNKKVLNLESTTI